MNHHPYYYVDETTNYLYLLLLLAYTPVATTCTCAITCTSITGVLLLPVVLPVLVSFESNNYNGFHNWLWRPLWYPSWLWWSLRVPWDSFLHDSPPGRAPIRGTPSSSSNFPAQIFPPTRAPRNSFLDGFRQISKSWTFPYTFHLKTVNFDGKIKRFVFPRDTPC